MDISARVRELDLPKDSYAVFGSGPLAIRGIREAHDIDLVITPELFKELTKREEWTPGELRDHHRLLKHNNGDVELFDSWAPGSWDVYELIRDADEIDGVPYVKLDSVIEWKTLRGTEKDKRDIELIKAFLAQEN